MTMFILRRFRRKKRPHQPQHNQNRLGEEYCPGPPHELGRVLDEVTVPERIENIIGYRKGIIERTPGQVSRGGNNPFQITKSTITAQTLPVSVPIRPARTRIMPDCSAIKPDYPPISCGLSNYGPTRSARNHPLRLCDLLDELLLRIIRFVNPFHPAFISVKLTCRRFNSITEDPALYRLTVLKIPAGSRFSFPVLLRVLDASGRHIVGVDLSASEDVTDHTLFRIVSVCGNLQWLNVSGCKQITNAGLRVLGNYLKGLQRLDMSDCPFITCAGVVELFKLIGKTLTFVKANDCLGLREDPHKLVSLARYCTSLRHLSVRWSRDLVKLNPLLDMDLDRLTQGCVNLEYLDVSYSHSTNGGVESIARNCPSLTTLIARQCFLQDIGLEYIGRGLIKMEWLDLTDCWYITDVGLESVAKGCPLLRGVILTRCYEIKGNGVIKMAATCNRLETFVLKQCFKIDSHAVECVGYCAKHLRCLDVSYNQHVTMDTVAKIKDNNRKLRVFTEGCPRVPRGGAVSRFHFPRKDPNPMVIWETAV